MPERVASSPAPLATVEGLRLRRGNFVLHVPTWSLRAGQVVGLVGPSGAGKSTLLRLLAGLEAPTEGSVSVLGMNPVTQLPQVRQQLGFLSDDQALFSLPIGRLLSHLSGYYPTWDVPLVDAMMARFKLDPTQRIDRLSKGASTRVRIVIALAHRPKVVLLDEPGLGLDLAARKSLLRTVVEIAGDGERSVVLSSHRLEDVTRITDRLLVLNDGVVVQEGPTDELVNDQETLEERLVGWGAVG